jgi:GNAT superfamily N-acetyltransferase
MPGDLDEGHPLAEVLDRAARGVHPAPDGRVEVVPSPPGPADAVVAFTAHTFVAARVEPDAVAAQLPEDSLSAPLQTRFLSWLEQQLRAEAGTLDVLLAADRDGVRGAELVEADELDHPRLRRARRYRSDLRVYDPDRRGEGLGRSLAQAARALVPAGRPLFAQVAPGNAASLRAFLAAGYRPIGAEILFLKPVAT